jgi:hypothetical protein
MGKKRGYFRPGMTRVGQFKETADLPEVNFEYRPLNMQETAELTDKVMAAKNVAGANVENMRMVSERLIKWDLTKQAEGDCQDGEVPVDFRNVEELKLVSPVIMNYITSVIRGDTANPLLDKQALEEQVKN